MNERQKTMKTNGTDDKPRGATGPLAGRGSPGKTGPARTRIGSIALLLGLLVMWPGIVGLVVIGSASAFDPTLTANLMIGGMNGGTIAIALVIGGFLSLAIGAILVGLKSKAAGMIGIGLGAIVLVAGVGVGLAVLFLPGGPGSCPSGQVWNGNACVSTGGAFSANWNCQWLATTGTAHDASTEFPDAPAIAADGGSPDIDGTIGTPIYNLDSKQMIWDIVVDDEANHPGAVGAGANTWLSEDAWAADVQCILTNQPMAVGGGLQAYPLWGQISVPRVVGVNNNYTDAVWYCDTTFGVYLGFGTIADAGGSASAHTADHSYLSYTSSRNCGSPPLSGDWVPLGTTATTGAGQVYVPVWQILANGLATLDDAAQQLVVTVNLGDNPGDSSFTGNVQTLTITLATTAD